MNLRQTPCDPDPMRRRRRRRRGRRERKKGKEEIVGVEREGISTPSLEEEMVRWSERAKPLSISFQVHVGADGMHGWISCLRLSSYFNCIISFCLRGNHQRQIRGDRKTHISIISFYNRKTRFGGCSSMTTTLSEGPNTLQGDSSFESQVNAPAYNCALFTYIIAEWKA